MNCDPSYSRHLNAGIRGDETEDALGSNGSVLFPPHRSSYSCIHMNGKEVFRFAVRAVPQSIESAMQKAGLTMSSIDWLLLHQVWNKQSVLICIYLLIVHSAIGIY